MTNEQKQKIKNYVDNAFTAAQLETNRGAQAEVRAVQNRLASRGSALSPALDHEMVRINSEKINHLLKVRGDALLDAYEIYNVPLDEVGYPSRASPCRPRRERMFPRRLKPDSYLKLCGTPEGVP